MDVSEVLRGAVAAVEAANVPDDLRRDAFRAALASYGLGSSHAGRDRDDTPKFKPPHEATPSTKATGASQSPSSELDTSEFFEKFASESGIAREALELVYFVKDNKPGISTSQRRLGENKADQTRSVALLLTAAYHFGADVVEVNTQIIRNECLRLKCLDAPNFASTIKSADGVSVTGAPRSKVFKFKQGALPKLETLVKHAADLDDK